MTAFREKLIKQVQQIGQDLIDKAETYVPDVNYIRRLDIDIQFDSEDGISIPEISIQTTCFCDETIRELRGES